MYKTLNDLERVINLNKPQKVIDVFVDSYLRGVAIEPYLTIEKEYQILLSTEDRDIKPQVLDHDNNVIFEAVDYNKIRNDRIAVLKAEHHYLIEPLPTFENYVVNEFINNEMVEVIKQREIAHPTLDERRPDLILDPNLTTSILRDYFKKQRLTKVENIIVEISGKLFDGDEISQTRMTRAALVMDDIETTGWVLAGDSELTQVTKAELLAAIKSAGLAQTAIWVQ